MTKGNRAGETNGRKLTPGERFQIWVDSIVKIWPVLVALVGLLGYTNREALMDLALAEPDGQTEIGASTDFQSKVKKFSEETVARFAALEARAATIEKTMSEQDEINLTASRDADAALQAQIDEIKKLVN